MTLVARFCKETTGKASKLSVLEEYMLCPVQNMYMFKSRLEEAYDIEEDHTIFKAFTEATHKCRPTSADTVAK